MRLLLAIFLLNILSCGTSTKRLSSDGAKVKELTYSKGHGCHVVDKVLGMNAMGSLELAKKHAKNLTAKADGNALYFDETVQNGKEIFVYATAFKCD